MRINSNFRILTHAIISTIGIYVLCSVCMSMHVSYGTTVTGHMYMYTEVISIILSTSDLVL